MRILFARQELARTALQPSCFRLQPLALPSADGGKTAAPSKSAEQMHLVFHSPYVTRSNQCPGCRNLYSFAASIELGSLQKCECFFNSASKRAELYPKNHAVDESKLYFERTDDKKHHARAMTDYLSNTIPKTSLPDPTLFRTLAMY